MVRELKNGRKKEKKMTTLFMDDPFLRADFRGSVDLEVGDLWPTEGKKDLPWHGIDDLKSIYRG